MTQTQRYKYIQKYMVCNGYTYYDATIISCNVVQFNDMYYDIDDVIYCVQNSIKDEVLRAYNDEALLLYQNDETVEIQSFKTWLYNKEV